METSQVGELGCHFPEKSYQAQLAAATAGI